MVRSIFDALFDLVFSSAKLDEECHRLYKLDFYTWTDGKHKYITNIKCQLCGEAVAHKDCEAHNKVHVEALEQAEKAFAALTETQQHRFLYKHNKDHYED